MTNSKCLAIRAFLDEPTNTISYLIWDRETKHGAVVDPVLDFDHRSGKASTASADEIIAAGEAEGSHSMGFGDPCPCRPLVGRSLR